MIRSTQSARPTVPLALLGAIVLAVVACSPSSGSLGTPAAPPSLAQPSIEAPSSNDATPAPPSSIVEPSTSPTEPGSTAAPSGSATPSPAANTVVRAYFFLGSFTGDAGLVPVLRVVPKTLAVATAAINALIAGPIDRELSARPAMYTTIPAGTRLLGITITAGVATVDLSAEFASGGGSASIFGRLAQVVYTLTQFPTVQSVLFKLDGQPVTTFSGEGIVLDHPVGRADYRDQIAGIFVDRPAWGAVLGNPATVSGLANVFEAQFLVRLSDASGTVLVQQPVTAGCGNGCWGTYSTTLTYSVTEGQWGTLRVYDPSAKDGSPQDVTDYPVWLAPAG